MINSQKDLHTHLDIHEDHATRETDGNDNQFGPKWPFQVPFRNLFRGAINEDVEAPNHTCDGCKSCNTQLNVKDNSAMKKYFIK